MSGPVLEVSRQRRTTATTRWLVAQTTEFRVPEHPAGAGCALAGVCHVGPTPAVMWRRSDAGLAGCCTCGSVVLAVYLISAPVCMQGAVCSRTFAVVPAVQLWRPPLGWVGRHAAGCASLVLDPGSKPKGVRSRTPGWGQRVHRWVFPDSLACGRCVHDGSRKQVHKQQPHQACSMPAWHYVACASRVGRERVSSSRSRQQVGRCGLGGLHGVPAACCTCLDAAAPRRRVC